MQVLINTDHNIEGYEALTTHLKGLVESAMNRISAHVTRVECHLTDENGHKSGGNDKRCVMEARLQGHQPIAVTHHAATVHQAVDGAAQKLTRLVESTIERRRDHNNQTPPPAQEPQIPED
ncbi:MAG: HPF/RaiA family ribosome-associated protein [Gammaproteobacteria bacterium]|nr:HPF/RaiA family ribosome-associated protein [Rhodocyclaceae bacterium]MBU3910349.1 HPF/RaiA family ribosome-associated protein [Gammaproteobacteria bacterium]MBU3990279.1 HPF/RaiA family ribosome-associated protein [Gammaproteobacteria bacterium]MBU4004176.1 HPF/RaiA family ribosome-associated protein [Gammaproteobacteria bacterium]MBU4020423.1 HPF/RaiA family ribosome-associated protein [Gammaproteobacteria bacterium]